MGITVTSKFASVHVAPNGPIKEVLDELTSEEQAKAATLIRKHLVGPLNELAATFRDQEELQRQLQSITVREDSIATT